MRQAIVALKNALPMDLSADDQGRSQAEVQHSVKSVGKLQAGGDPSLVTVWEVWK